MGDLLILIVHKFERFRAGVLILVSHFFITKMCGARPKRNFQPQIPNSSIKFVGSKILLFGNWLTAENYYRKMENNGKVAVQAEAGRKDRKYSTYSKNFLFRPTKMLISQ
jgi:outer membrane protein assembly factor BamD (BamD/ComL family)